MTQPYLSLCVLFRDNADTLPTLLESIADCFDEFVFCDTGSTDGSRALVNSFLMQRTGKIVDFEWCDDFSKARQFNYDQATGRWKMFLDSDDRLIDGQKIRPLLVKFEASDPQLEAYFVPYEYGHLETLMTMRLHRHRPGWAWTDAVHERNEFTYPDGEPLPEDAFGRTSEFKVRHKGKSPEEKERAIRRNARIAEREYAASTDVKYRARLGRTLAMEAKMDGRAAVTIPWLEDLYNHYRTFPEGRQAAADIAKAYLHLSAEGSEDDFDDALRWAKRAGPAYEAIVQHAAGQFEAVLKSCQRSAGMGPQTTHEGLIFEQGAVYVAAADAAMSLGLGPSVAEQILGKIPVELRNDKSIGPHVNLLRGQIDRITIVVPGTPQPFDENGGGGMLGGSEEAVVYLTRALAQAGRNVRVFGVLPPHRLPGPDRHGVDWRNMSAFNPDDEHGTLVLWRSPGMLLNMMREAGKLGRTFAGILQVFLWLHDSGLGISPEAAKVVAAGCAGAVILSDFHARMVARNGYNGKLLKASNGVVEQDFFPYIDEDHFDLESGYLGERDPFSVVYSSCPSRGLMQLLAMWPVVKAAVPKARLDLYYDWSMLEQMQPRKFEEVMLAYEAVKHLDVIHHGGVDHQTLHAALRQANIWAYAHFESPEVETSCISLMKAVACGATALVVPNGALPETGAGLARFETSVDAYREALIELLNQPEATYLRRAHAHEMLHRFGWTRVADTFSDLWSIKSRIQNVPTALDATKSVDMVLA